MLVRATDAAEHDLPVTAYRVISLHLAVAAGSFSFAFALPFAIAKESCFVIVLVVVGQERDTTFAFSTACSFSLEELSNSADWLLHMPAPAVFGLLINSEQMSNAH